MVSEKLWKWVKKAAEDFKNEDTNVKDALVHIEGQEEHGGLGYVVKQYLHPVLLPDALDMYGNPEPSYVTFTVQDGDRSLFCGMHNCGQEFGIGDPISHINDKYEMLHDSMRHGHRVRIRGTYRNFDRKRIFMVREFEIDKTEKISQLTDKQFKKFIELCQEESVSPLGLMLDTLWEMFLAEDDLKKAVMLYCLSPQHKWDMFHVGIVSSVGEGKDTLREHVIEPMVPSGFAGGRAVSTVAALVGAMSGDDIGTVNLGLLPKYHGERVVCSEFQTWEPEMFGGILSAMADGKVPINKGAVVGTWRNTVENFLFLGNPPREWNPTADNKMKTIECFGENTPQMISRITLLFSKLKLTEKKDEVKRLMAKNLDRPYIQTKKQDNTLTLWQRFFREYLRYVSCLPVEVVPAYDALYDTYKGISTKPEFREIFYSRMAEDNRKWQQWMVLCKSFAKLGGRTEISMDDIVEARNLWVSSLATLVEEFDLEMIGDDANPFFNRIYNHIRENPDCTTQDLKESKPGIIYSVTLVKSTTDRLKAAKKIFEVNGHYFPSDSQYAQVRPEEDEEMDAWLDAYLTDNPMAETKDIITAARVKWPEMDEVAMKDRIFEANKRALENISSGTTDAIDNERPVDE